ncbi:hypothetical protein DFH09DRAFT_1193326 [Mycena vulgaris]|nr:hypothetical protein DFH09DRAFT_1193326 [Mycena vulgaris]
MMSRVLSPLSPALMSFTCVTNAYRLVVVLSFVQLTSGIATIALYGINGGVFDKVIQLAPPVLRYTRRADANILSRVEGQYYFLIYLIGIWLLCGCLCQPRAVPETRASCIPAGTTSARCCLDRRRHYPPAGDHRRRCVPSVPLQTILLIRQWYPALQPPATLIPAWMAPHVSELRREHDESTAKSAIATHVV